MSTPVCAFQLESGQTFSESGERYVVVFKDQPDDFIDMLVREIPSGDEFRMCFAPFDVVTLVT